MLEKLSVLALPLIGLFMIILLIYALWPERKPEGRSSSRQAADRNRAAPRRGAQRRF